MKIARIQWNDAVGNTIYEQAVGQGLVHIRNNVDLEPLDPLKEKISRMRVSCILM